MPVKKSLGVKSQFKKSLSTHSNNFAKGLIKNFRKSFRNPVIEIENPHLDAQSAAGIEESGYDSFVSLPANRVNIPEVKEGQASFVYNYFTRDERVRILNSSKDKILDLQSDFANDVFFNIANDKLPRFVKISFKPPKTYGIIKKTNVSAKIKDNLEKIYIEGATSNTFFTGIEFIDSGKEPEQYNRIKSSMILADIATPEDSPRAAIEDLYETLGEKGGLFGEDKKMLKQALSNMQSEGYTAAPSDVPPEIADFSSDPLTKQAFSIQFNNLFMSEIVKSATKIPDNVFQDEFRAITNFADNVKKKILKSIDPNKISEADYEITVQAVDLKPIRDLTSYKIANQKQSTAYKNFSKKILDKYPKIKLAGYMIHKYEVLPDETTNFMGNFYSDNPNGLFIVDPGVRYGGNYVYKIRTICEVQTIIRTIPDQKSAGSLEGLAVATMLVASEGETIGVTCVERVPPPPPENLRVGFNFRKKLPFLTWQFPLNVQRDIKRFQIFRRYSLNEPFMLIAELDFDDSVIKGGVTEIALDENLYDLPGPAVNYTDISFELGSEPIYTLASVDAHGMSSNYGAQIKMKYNKYLNTITTTLISRPNAPKPYPNLLVEVDSFEDAIKVSGYERMKVFFDPEYYKVYKNEKKMRRFGRYSFPFKKEVSQEFLRVNPNKDTYKIHIMNFDLQKDQIVNIRIADKSGSPISAGPAQFSAKNLSFEYGV